MRFWASRGNSNTAKNIFMRVTCASCAYAESYGILGIHTAWLSNSCSITWTMREMMACTWNANSDVILLCGCV